MEGRSRLRMCQVELELFEGEPKGFVTCNPTSPAAGRTIEKIRALVHRQVW